MEQLSLYDIAYENYKIKKPIRLIELFSGYGSQALALKYLGVKFEYWKTCEWAVKSIQAYKDIHFTDVDVELNPKRTKEDMINFLYKKGISADYNKPMTKEQISRLNENQLKTIIKNIAITNDLVNIQQVRGEDLEIVDTDKFTYILTYSFPCQDLSLAGKKLGMDDTSTRSGLLWEVERILQELKELNSLPGILLMENVPQIHNVENVEPFNKFKAILEQLGYSNYFKDLIATDYGIPQTRNRCFMVSILGEYNYTFPKPIPLKLKLKNMLEENVDKKYYLSDKQVEQISHWNSYQNPLESVMGKESISPTITTRIAESQDGGINASMKVYSDSLQNTTNIRIKNTNSKGYLEAEAEFIGTYQFSNSDKFMHKKSRFKKRQTVGTLWTTPKEAVVTSGEKSTNNLRIRKLTPRECFRLMGVKDEDFDNVAKSQSDSSLYHLAGDSIVVNVLMAIFKELI